MHNLLKYLFGDWKRPVQFWFAGFVVAIVSELIGYLPLCILCGWLLLIGCVGLLFSFVYQICNKKWRAFYATLLSGIIALCLLVVISIWYTFGGGDHYARFLSIPHDIAVNKPCLMQDSLTYSSMTNAKKSAADFQIYESFQPGIYQSEFWYGRLEAGRVYLRVFEVTNNDPLSAERVEKNTEMEISNTSDTLKKFAFPGDFTIYEGDWGDDYAARFEVWFRPSAGTGERKLMEKCYQIQGWLR